MNHAFESWNHFKPQLREKDVMLFLDYDGTLTPIVARPENAELSVETKKLLGALQLVKGLHTAIVSGRSLEQLKVFVGVPGFVYIGNHGFEIEASDFHHIHPGAVEAKGIMQEIAENLNEAFQPIPEVVIENKEFTLSVHYRQVSPDKVDRVHMIFLKALHPFLDEPQVVFTEGKKVLEVRPAVGWNKGTAVAWLYGRKLASNPSRKILPIYIGDDRTDEAALKAVKDYGIAVKVGEDTSGSHADYYLRDSEELYDFLKRIYQVRTGLEFEV